MKLDSIDIFYIQGERSLIEKISTFSLQDLIDEFHKSKENFPNCNDYYNFLLEFILRKSYEIELKKLKPIIDNDFKKNKTSYLHNRLVASYCQRIGVKLKELLEDRFILKEHYPCGYNFAIDFHIQNECFKDKSPIPAEDANIEYKRYVPDEIKKKNIDFWLVSTLLKKMVITEDMALDLYLAYKEIGYGFGMERAASRIKKE